MFVWRRTVRINVFKGSFKRPHRSWRVDIESHGYPKRKLIKVDLEARREMKGTGDWPELGSSVLA